MTGNAAGRDEWDGIVRLARDALALSSSLVGAAIISFLVWLYLARVLPPSDYGALAAALAFVALFQMFGDFGVNYYTVREGARDAALATGILRTMFGLKLALLGGATAVVLVFAFALPFRPTERSLIFVYVATLPIAGAATYLSSLLNAHRRMKRLASVQLAERIAYAILVPPLVALGLGAQGVVLAAVTSAGLYAFVVWLAIAPLRTGPLWPPSPAATWRPHFSAAFTFGLAALLMSILQRVDVVFVAILSDPTTLAAYVAAVQVFLLILLVATGLAQAALPWMVRRVHEGKMTIRGLWKWAAFLGIFSAGIAVAASAGAPAAFVLLFGPNLAAGEAAFRVLVWAIVPSFTTIPVSLAIDAYNLQKVHVLNATAMVTLSVVLNLAWIPTMGATGAAWAAVASWGYGLVVGMPIALFVIRRRQQALRIETVTPTAPPSE